MGYDNWNNKVNRKVFKKTKKTDRQELESKEGPLSISEVEAFMDLVFSFDPSSVMTLKEKISLVAREISEKEGQVNLLKELIKKSGKKVDL